MQLNSFQKNGFVNVNNNNSNAYNSGNFGHRSVQDIRDDMLKAKTKNVNSETKLNDNNQSFDRKANANKTHQQRVDAMRNFDRWK